MKKVSGDKDFPRKFESWNFKEVSNFFKLILSVIYPIDRNRLMNTFVYIKIEEQATGFRVISATAESFESQPEEDVKVYRDDLIKKVKGDPGSAFCLVWINIMSINASTPMNLIYPRKLGQYDQIRTLDLSLNSEEIIGDMNRDFEK
jgi:hypothetical protein